MLVSLKMNDVLICLSLSAGMAIRRTREDNLHVAIVGGASGVEVMDLIL